MANYELGPFNRVLLLGGGALLVRLALWAREAGYSVRVITAPRHAAEMVDGISDQTLLTVLSNAGIDTDVINNIDSDEARKAIGNIERTFSLSLGAAWIFKKNVIEDVFQGKLFNLHGTRLPQNRGGGGFSWQILMGNRLGFCMLHVLDAGVDTGDIVAHEEFIYPPSCRTPLDFAAFYQEQNFKFLVSLLDATRGQQQAYSCVVQPEYLSTYWPRIHTSTHSWIDWSWSAAEIEKFICAFDDPYSGAQTFWRKKMVRLKKAFANYQEGYFHPAQAGLIYRVNKNWLCVACKDGAIIIEQLVDEAGNSLIQEICIGDALTTPVENLGQFGKRPVYTANNSTPKF